MNKIIYKNQSFFYRFNKLDLKSDFSCDLWNDNFHSLCTINLNKEKPGDIYVNYKNIYFQKTSDYDILFTRRIDRAIRPWCKKYGMQINLFNLVKTLSKDYLFLNVAILIKKIFNICIAGIEENGLFITFSENKKILSLELDQIYTKEQIIKTADNMYTEVEKIFEQLKIITSKYKQNDISVPICKLNRTRKLDEIRKINIFTTPTVFQRGKTSVLSIIQKDIKFNSQYVFNHNSKYSNRREIGHSNLIKSAFKNYINEPIKLIAEVLSADGSSSAASVCAHSINLRNKGYLSELIAGISLGNINNQWIVDMTEEEDNESIMDFKIFGTKTHISAIHLDTKKYIYLDDLSTILTLGQKKLIEIINKMNKFALGTIKQIPNIQVLKKYENHINFFFKKNPIKIYKDNIFQEIWDETIDYFINFYVLKDFSKCALIFTDKKYKDGMLETIHGSIQIDKYNNNDILLGSIKNNQFIVNKVINLLE